MRNLYVIMSMCCDFETSFSLYSLIISLLSESRLTRILFARIIWHKCAKYFCPALFTNFIFLLFRTPKNVRPTCHPHFLLATLFLLQRQCVSSRIDLLCGCQDSFFRERVLNDVGDIFVNFGYALIFFVNTF